MTITAIVAVAENLAIGKDGKLPWHYPADLKFFKETTTGHAIAMGFHTWQSIGKPLPNRLSLVLSRANTLEHRPRVVLARSPEEIIALAKFLKGDLFIIGGAATYRVFAGVIERWIVTRIPGSIDDADAFMPADFLDGFELGRSLELEGGLPVKIYERKNDSEQPPAGAAA